MAELFTIGEISRLFNVNIRTLRYYDNIGLLKPEYVNPQSGYRYYSVNQFELLNTIKYLRALDVSIEDIKYFIENRDINNIINILDIHKKNIEKERIKLQIIEQKINNRLKQIKDALNTNYGVIEEKYIEERTIALLKRNINVNENLEYKIRELENENGLGAVMFLGKVGVSISKKNIENNIFESFSSIFVILENECVNKGKTETIKEGKYVSVRFKGTHTEAKEYYEMLIKYINEHNYKINGNSVEITLIDYGMTTDKEKFVTEIQIPYL